MAVKALDIRPADILPLFRLQAAGHFVNGTSSAPVAFMMLTERVDRQDGVQLHRHPFQDHRVPG
ncbi:hypothetical protein [Enterobacter ludwigii]